MTTVDGARSATAAGQRLTSWFVAEATPRQLTIWRVWAAGVTVVYLVVRARAIVNASGTFSGIGVLWWLNNPWPTAWLWALLIAAVVSLSALASGRRVAIAGVVGTGATLLLLTHRSSFGQILWFDIVMVLHLLVLAAAHVPRAGSQARAETAGWGIRLAALISAATYVVSGITKLQVSGLAWVSDGALETHIAFTATRAEVLGATPSPIAASLIDLGITSTPLALFALTLELGAPVALVSRRLAWVWSMLMWSMHVVIAATMFIVFHWPLTGALFVPTILAASLHRSDAR